MNGWWLMPVGRLQFNVFLEFASEIKVLDVESEHCGIDDISIIFTAANVEEDKASEESKINLDRYVAPVTSTQPWLPTVTK